MVGSVNDIWKACEFKCPWLFETPSRNLASGTEEHYEKPQVSRELRAKI